MKHTAGYLRSGLPEALWGWHVRIVMKGTAMQTLNGLHISRGIKSNIRMDTVAVK